MPIRVFLFLALIIGCACGNAEETAVSNPQGSASQAIEETITIPLETIWSTNQKSMWSNDEPVTRYIGELEESGRDSGQLVNAIRKELGSGSIQIKAQPAFAVEGKGLEALKNAYAVLVEKQPRRTTLSRKREVSIVFFSLYSPYHVTLTEAKRRGNTVQIKYELIPREESMMFRQFSLIPLGILSPGKYQVSIDHEPYEKRFRKFGQSGPDDRMLGRVSTSFEFEVK